MFGPQGGRYDLVSAAARAQAQGAMSSSTAGNFGQSTNPQLRSPMGTIQVSNMSQFSLGNQGFPGTIQMPLQSGHISPQVMRTQQANLALKAGNHAAAAPDSQANLYQRAGNHAAVALDSHGSLMQARSSSGGVQGSLTQSRSSPDGEQLGGSDQLHKQLLAQEVVKVKSAYRGDARCASAAHQILVSLITLCLSFNLYWPVHLSLCPFDRHSIHLSIYVFVSA